MTTDIINVLQSHQNHPLLGAVIEEALGFVSGQEYKSKPSGGGSELSTSIARIYRVRSGLRKFRKERWSGMAESILSLEASATPVKLHVIETKCVLVSAWLDAETGVPIGVLIAKFPIPGTGWLIGSEFDR